MAWDESSSYNKLTGVAGADLSAKQFFAVAGSNDSMVIATAAKSCMGILQDNPVSGKAGAYAVSGICKVAISATQTLTKGVTQLEVDTAGTLKALASGIAVAIAEETLASNAGVVIIAARLLPSNGLFA
jgi:hypothetical protein